MTGCPRLMIRPRPSACLACVLHLASLLAFAQTPPIETPAPLPAEFAALLEPKWSFSADVETAFGYKDNLLLSASGEERSALVRGSVEFMLMRLATRNGMDYSLFAQVGGTRFVSGRSVDHEAEAWVQSDLGYRFSDTFKVSLPLTGYYDDKVSDVSDSEVERIVAEFKVSGAMVGPMVRWDFHPSGWLEAQAVGERKRYDDGANDSEVGEGRLHFGWKFNRRFEARLAAKERWRGFDERLQYTSAGRALSGTELKLAEREGELRFDIYWDARRTWRTSTRAIGLERRDNGPGYFDFDSARITQEVSWTSDRWRLRWEGGAERLEFRVQTVGISIEPPPRIEEEYFSRLRIERRLSPRWTLLAEYNWVRSRSNDPIASYSLNEGLLGARWSWEK